MPSEVMVLLRAAGALLAVLGAVLFLAWIARRLGLHERFAGPSAGRLAVVESRWLDARTRLVLVRCDGVEHLLLLGNDGARVLERRIAGRGQRDRSGAGS
ncbi:MAG: flagellar biosynthetic protein FliO [Geminicoccaceae bacterium]|nr:flagellar biosynthetic protein FliO [Geminicoccaceae bacterium]MCX7630578.1 flagellar biosynthetic protein FliO [Geminicoccaceae bacterium]MDW8125435.1 flagellar biosynthetic protein FliO [Geminicoccaceae bacterium]